MCERLLNKNEPSTKKNTHTEINHDGRNHLILLFINNISPLLSLTQTNKPEFE